MRLVWMVLAVLTVLAGTASATRIATCECRAGSILPERGARDVPTNAKIWRLTDSSDVHRATPVAERDLLGVEVIERPFAPNDLIDDANGVLFTTGASRDDTPPAAPHDVTVSFATNDDGNYSEVASALIHGGFDDDTALLRLDIYDGGGVISMITRRDRLFLCEPSIRLVSRRVDVEVRALDLAGNASPPVRVRAYLETSTDHTPRCAHASAVDDEFEGHYTRCGNPLIILVVLAYPMILLVWLVVALVRRGLIGRNFAEPLSMLHAEAVVRRLLRRQYAWTALVLAAEVAAAMKLHEDVAFLFAPWLISAVAQLLMLRRASALLERPEADAARRGPWLVVTALRSSIAVQASASAFAAGKREAIPRSVAK